jgi:type I restriction enzyme M protein
MNGQPDFDPCALPLQLRSPLGQWLLDSIVSGATITMIQLRELVRLPVLLPSAETAAQAAEALEEEARIQQEIDRLRGQQAKVAAEVRAFD